MVQNIFVCLTDTVVLERESFFFPGKYTIFNTSMMHTVGKLALNGELLSKGDENGYCKLTEKYQIASLY